MDLLIDLSGYLLLIAIFLFEIANVRYYFKLPKDEKKPDFIKNIKKIANIRKMKVNKRKVYIIEPNEISKTTFTILYIHGGAYVGGISMIHWNFVYNLLKDTKAKIIFPDYPLAPKKTYKEVFELIKLVYETIPKNDKLIVLGDSAGGAISLALTELMAKENKSLPEKLILISPWLDITMKNKKIDEVQKEDKVLNKQILKLASEMYSGKENMDDFLLSPINGEVDGLPPITIFTGTSDMLNPDVHIFEKKFTDASKLKIYEKENASHNWVIDDIKGNNEDYQKLLSEILN